MILLYEVLFLKGFEQMRDRLWALPFFFYLGDTGCREDNVLDRDREALVGRGWWIPGTGVTWKLMDPGGSDT